MRGLGAKRSAAHKLARRRLAADHPLLGGSIPASATLAAHEPSRLDQGPTGSCTAHGLAGAVYTAAAGTLAFVPSPDVEYKCTRALERAAMVPAGETLFPLQDSGAELADAIDAMRTYGVAKMGPSTPDGRHSDVDPETVNSEPSFPLLEEAATAIVTGEYGITSTGPQRSADVASAIAAGFPVYVGFFVDTAFEALQPGQVAQAPNEADPKGGGHAVYLSAYTTGPDGSRVFTLTNSWGESWCDQGRCLVGESWLAAAWELWIVDITISKGAAS